MADKPARIKVTRTRDGRWRVLVNGSVWAVASTRDAAEAEAEWLRWPSQPPRYVAGGAA